MALTTAQLIGTPVNANEFDLDGALEAGKKATGASSSIAVGRIVFLTGSSGVWAIATSGSTGRMAIVPKLHQGDGNTDSSASITVAARPGARYFAESNGTLKPGCQLLPDTGGKVKSTSGQGFAVYKGHDGEGSNGNPPTDGAAAEAVIIELSGDVI